MKSKTPARACESCLKSRARWFCPADDAFLCHACDSSVHSANDLAARHHRVRLQHDDDLIRPTPPHHDDLPAWHQGFAKKARTPRHAKRGAHHDRIPVVPQMSGDEGSEESEEEQMAFSVPTFNPNCFELPFCDDDDMFNLSTMIGDQGGPRFERDLVDFAADVESLLSDEVHSTVPNLFVKVEDEEEIGRYDHFNWALDLENEIMSFEINNNGNNCRDDDDGYDEEEKKRKVLLGANVDEDTKIKIKNRGSIFLRLNYDEIINAWDGSSPWTNGLRPVLDPNHDGWPNHVGDMNTESKGVTGGGRREMKGGDDGRQARVSRYREKRRTRLFSKKIRYEVRKLNAEKRPRLKGRFVKRTSIPLGLPPLPCITK